MKRRAFVLAPAWLLACAPPEATWGPEAYPNGLSYQGLAATPAVTVYMTSWCPVCRQARAWLEAQGEPFVERNVEEDDGAARRFLALNPRGTVPTFVIDGRVYVGFDRLALTEALRNLPPG